MKGGYRMARVRARSETPMDELTSRPRERNVSGLQHTLSARGASIGGESLARGGDKSTVGSCHPSKAKRHVVVVESFAELIEKAQKAQNTDFILVECKGASGGMSWAAVHLKWQLETYFDDYKVVE